MQVNRSASALRAYREPAKHLHRFFRHAPHQRRPQAGSTGYRPQQRTLQRKYLGDKTRMEALSRKNAFIRPSPSARIIGRRCQKDPRNNCSLWSCRLRYGICWNRGVGQSETAVHSMVDFFLLIQLAGTGDELQGIKRGIMEMADGL